MKKLTSVLYFIVSLLTAFSLAAQPPSFYNSNLTTGSNNAFPLNNSAASAKVQWFIPPQNLGSGGTGVGPVSAGNNITAVYFHAGSAATRVYPALTVKLKTGSGTGLTGATSGPVEPGMTTVYSANNVTISTTLNSWIKITLQTPFLYDPNQPLIVELEHSGTTGTGPSLRQALNIPGPGNGRQWANYNGATLNGTGANQVNFGIDVIPATPCVGAPPANTVIPSNITTCAGLANPSFSIASTYSLGGLTYQWFTSTVTPMGPYTAINGATLSTSPSLTLGTTTWLQLVATCTNVGGTSTTLTPGQVSVLGTVTQNVPYYESFETLNSINQLPNCSWTSSNMGGTTITYTTVGSDNRVPRTGSNFASFHNTPAGTSDYYSNGIFMNAGVTYSAAIWYITASGYTNWTNLELGVGPNQNPTGLVTLAATNGTVTPILYTPLTNTFTVPGTGIYYISVKATSTTGVAPYLSWDDLSVTIPCELNGPNLTMASDSSNICDGDAVNIMVSGADSYLWSDGSTLSSLLVNPNVNTVYSVVGTEQLSGCTRTLSHSVYVRPTPVVNISASENPVCPGEVITLTAHGADTYFWAHGPMAASTTVAPTTNTTYFVSGANLVACTASTGISITVNPAPVINLSGSGSLLCKGEILELSADGGITYHWYTSPNQVLIGSQVKSSPMASGTYTLIAANNFGCETIKYYSFTVDACAGIAGLNGQENKLSLYPNPTKGLFIVESALGSISAVEVSDPAGKVIFSAKGTDKKLAINLEDAASGIYFVKITTNDATRRIKVVKE